jgi:hypothetical protein
MLLCTFIGIGIDILLLETLGELNAVLYMDYPLLALSVLVCSDLKSVSNVECDNTIVLDLTHYHLP